VINIGRVVNIPINLETWYPIATTWDSGGNVRLYVDTAPSGTSVSVPYTLYSRDGHLARNSAGGAGFDWYHGIIDEVRIYNKALTASEIAQLATPGLKC
jgi:hypothetical protein